VPWAAPTAPGVVDRLSPDGRRHVMRIRRMLAPLADAADALDVGGQDDGANYLPACERYVGRI